MKNTSKLHIISGDITDDRLIRLADAIVVPTNPMMRCGAGVSSAVFQKAGVDVLEQYTERTFGISYYDKTRKNEMKTTEVRITPGFALPCDIIFAQGPKLYDFDDFRTALKLLLRTYHNILQKSVECGFKNILIPALGTGLYGFTHDSTAKQVVNVISSFIRRHQLDVYFVVSSDEIKELYKLVLERTNDNE
ncbi:MAG: macro domain-containing protein [Ruminococcus sp.]|nr:macro domain-containing protein [Ruminococcus sp.]